MAQLLKAWLTTENTRDYRLNLGPEPLRNCPGFGLPVPPPPFILMGARVLIPEIPITHHFSYQQGRGELVQVMW